MFSISTHIIDMNAIIQPRPTRFAAATRNTYRISSTDYISSVTEKWLMTCTEVHKNTDDEDKIKYNHSRKSRL